MINTHEVAAINHEHLHNPIIWTTQNELMSVLEHLAQKSPILVKWFWDLAQKSGVLKDILH